MKKGPSDKNLLGPTPATPPVTSRGELFRCVLIRLLASNQGEPDGFCSGIFPDKKLAIRSVKLGPSTSSPSISSAGRRGHGWTLGAVAQAVSKSSNSTLKFGSFTAFILSEFVHAGLELGLFRALGFLRLSNCLIYLM